MMKYPVYDGDKMIGEALIRQEGMFSVIQCNCMPQSRKPQRVYIQTGEKSIDLGLCLPDGNSMTLLKRISTKKLDTSQMKFCLAEEPTGVILFVQGQAFDQIDMLPDAKLQIRDGKYYVVMSESAKPTGQ